MQCGAKCFLVEIEHNGEKSKFKSKQDLQYVPEKLYAFNTKKLLTSCP